jgi:predicted RNase H-like HicB family nuclease
MNGSFTAVVQERHPWWVGWIQEIPGVNSQASSREELLDDLRSALGEALEMNRADALTEARDAPYEEVQIHVAA